MAKMRASAQKRMLEDLLSGPKPMIRYVGSVADKLLDKMMICRCDHPTIIDRRSGLAADAYAITDAGRDVV